MRGVETGKNGAKTHVPLKMADFLWTWHHGVHRRFCASGHDEGVYRVPPDVKSDVMATGRWRYDHV